MGFNEEECFLQLRKKLTPGVRVGWERTLFNAEKQVTELHRAFGKLVEDLEPFNVIVLGPPGSGKNTFVETCLYLFGQKNALFYRRRRIIRLNGITCGRNLRASVNEIFSHLKLSDSFSGRNAVNFEDRLDTIMEIMRGKLNKKSTKSRIPIFILDNLEYFCEGVQTLLYNLFDSCSGGKGLLGVIGITTCTDITELFEKRVKSRFSHRIIRIGQHTAEEYLAMAISLMSVNNQSKWNKAISALMSSPDVQKRLRQLYDTDRSIGQLTLFLYEVVTTSVTVNDIQDKLAISWDKFNRSTKVSQCLDLTVYDMMLVLAMRLLYPQTFTFDNLWQQISKLAAQFKAERADLKSSLITLESAELVLPVKMRGKQQKKTEAVIYRCGLSFEELNEVFKQYPNLHSAFQEYISN